MGKLKKPPFKLYSGYGRARAAEFPTLQAEAGAGVNDPPPSSQGGAGHGDWSHQFKLSSPLDED